MYNMYSNIGVSKKVRDSMGCSTYVLPEKVTTRRLGVLVNRYILDHAQVVRKDQVVLDWLRQFLLLLGQSPVVDDF